MPIEQIFELKGPWPPGRTCTPLTGCLHDKTIFSKKNIQLDCYLLLKYCRRQCTLLYYLGQITYKIYPIMQDLKRVLDLNCKQKED